LPAVIAEAVHSATATAAVAVAAEFPTVAREPRTMAAGPRAEAVPQTEAAEAGAGRSAMCLGSAADRAVAHRRSPAGAPLVAETPEHLLDDDTTPIDKFFVRNNGPIPEAAREPDNWKIVIDKRSKRRAWEGNRWR